MPDVLPDVLELVLELLEDELDLEDVVFELTWTILSTGSCIMPSEISVLSISASF